MVDVLHNISERILNEVDGIQVEYERTKVAIGDIEGVAIPTIRRYEAGEFGLGNMAGRLVVDVDLFTRTNADGLWFVLASKVLRALSGFVPKENCTGLEFLAVTYGGYKDNLYLGTITFEFRNYTGGLL